MKRTGICALLAIYALAATIVAVACGCTKTENIPALRPEEGALPQKQKVKCGLPPEFHK